MLSDAVDNVLTGRILKCFYEVYNTLAYGYLEKVYENALKIELEKAGFKVEQQKPVKVYYKGALVGDYFIDLSVEDSVLLELKSVSQLTEAHENQLVNYLVATRTQVGLLLNFGPVPENRRRINTLIL